MTDTGVTPLHSHSCDHLSYGEQFVNDGYSTSEIVLLGLSVEKKSNLIMNLIHVYLAVKHNLKRSPIFITRCIINPRHN